jgi:hypothetical protein
MFNLEMMGVKEVCTLEFADKFSAARLELKADTEREREREREDTAVPWQLLHMFIE